MRSATLTCVTQRKKDLVESARLNPSTRLSQSLVWVQIFLQGETVQRVIAAAVVVVVVVVAAAAAAAAADTLPDVHFVCATTGPPLVKPCEFMW